MLTHSVSMSTVLAFSLVTTNSAYIDRLTDVIKEQAKKAIIFKQILSYDCFNFVFFRCSAFHWQMIEYQFRKEKQWLHAIPEIFEALINL